PAPALFSMMMGWPSWRDTPSSTLRATMSVPPPGGNGTTTRMGWSGQAASAEVAASARPASRLRNRIFMGCLLLPWVDSARCALGMGSAGFLAEDAQHVVHGFVRDFEQACGRGRA